MPWTGWLMFAGFVALVVLGAGAWLYAGGLRHRADTAPDDARLPPAGNVGIHGGPGV